MERFSKQAEPPFRIFIGWDSRFPEPALVMAHSLLARSTIPLDIRFLDLRHLRDCYDFNPKPDPRATTEFTFSRFLVPWLCGYRGRAVFVDNDMLCLDDVATLATVPLAEDGYALRCVQHDHQVIDGSLKMAGAVQTSYPRKNFSSLMLMDCAQLGCWTKEVVEEADGARLHRFADVPDNKLGHLAPVWNCLDAVPEGARIVHWTSGGPWNDLTREWPHQDLWFSARRAWLADTGRHVDTPVQSHVRVRREPHRLFVGPESFDVDGVRRAVPPADFVKAVRDLGTLSADERAMLGGFFSPSPRLYRAGFLFVVNGVPFDVDLDLRWQTGMRSWADFVKAVGSLAPLAAGERTLLADLFKPEQLKQLGALGPGTVTLKMIGGVAHHIGEDGVARVVEEGGA